MDKSKVFVPCSVSWFLFLPSPLTPHPFLVTQAIKDVAKQLGNRPATCRKYYVHPAIIDAYMDGSLFQTMEQRTKQESDGSPSELQAEEQAVLKLLEQHLVQESDK